MRSVVIIAALIILGVAALGLIVAQKGGTRTTMAASTVHINVVAKETSALPIGSLAGQIAQTTNSEASRFSLEANVDVQSGRPMTTLTESLSADQSLTRTYLKIA
jgi:hypothetical protein